jgi:hypothetical protein
MSIGIVGSDNRGFNELNEQQGTVLITSDGNPTPTYNNRREIKGLLIFSYTTLYLRNNT